MAEPTKDSRPKDSTEERKRKFIKAFRSSGSNSMARPAKDRREKSRKRAETFVASLNYGVMYSTGSKYELGDELPRDLVQAYMHFQVAADSGLPAAAKAKNRVKQLELRMSASDIADAKRLAREFTEKKD